MPSSLSEGVLPRYPECSCHLRDFLVVTLGMNRIAAEKMTRAALDQPHNVATVGGVNYAYGPFIRRLETAKSALVASGLGGPWAYDMLVLLLTAEAGSGQRSFAVDSLIQAVRAFEMEVINSAPRKERRVQDPR